MPLLAQTAGLFTHAGFAIAGATAVSIPIIIHLLTRIRRRPVQWGAMKFLLEAYRKHRRRLQLEQIILLLVRCLVLLILGFALAGPLLGGCAQQFGIDATGRTVSLIIDDGLSGQAIAEGDTGPARFERQKKLALKMIDGLGSADQVAVYRTARPADAPIDPPTIDRASARRMIEAMKPRAARSDIPAAIKEARATITEKGIPADRAFIVLLSDFSHGSLAVDQAIATESVRLDQQARLLVARPMPSVANVQLTRFTPRRHLILTGGYAAEGPPRIPVEIELQRFADSASSRVTAVNLSLILGDSGRVLATFDQEEVRWPAEETKVTIKRDLILPAKVLDELNLTGGAGRLGAAGGSSGAAAGATVVIKAEIEPDALGSDNERFAVVELRQRLRVAVAGDATTATTGADKEITANQWMSIALAPGQDLGALEVSQVPAFDLDEKKIASADAVVVLRPDQVSDAGWLALKQLIDRGGTVWLFAPAAQVPAQWGDAVRTRLGVDWQIGIEPETLGGAAPVPAAPPAAPVAPSASQGIGLAADLPVPELMQRLSADWKDLLRPVHVKKRLPISLGGRRGVSVQMYTKDGKPQVNVKASDGTPDGEVWLATSDGKPLLVSATVGDGSVFLLGTALDLTWTNLPAKPLFVPLLHETLANVQAKSAEAARLAKVVSGDQPVMSRVWDGVAQLERILPAPAAAGTFQTIVAPDPPRMLRRTDEGFVPVEPIDQPGIFRAAPDSQGRVFVVNVDAAGGNTTAIEQAQLEAWLGGLGETKWLDEDNPASALAQFESRTNIGLLLLWLTLAFVLLEVFLARWFSHAHTGGQSTVMGMGANLYNRFVGKPKA